MSADAPAVRRVVLQHKNGDRYEGDMVNGKFHGNGTYYWRDGTRYSGDWVEGRQEGKGDKMWPNGDRHEGDFVNNVAHGWGVRISANGDVYEGDWYENRKSGHGKWTRANGCSYEGDWKNDTFEGRGVYIRADGTVFEGTWLKGKLCGRGIKRWPNGDQYVGEFENNASHGRGKRIWSNGDVYEGEWRFNRKDGKGMWMRANGAKYEGDWKNDLFDGIGSYTWPDGSRYDGEWKKGKQCGQGLKISANGDTYEGEFRDNLACGYGVKKWASGDVYEGDWQAGCRSGRGKRTFTNGEVYEGHWLDNKPHGQGRESYPNGDMYDGEWVAGEPSWSGHVALTFPNGDHYGGEIKPGKRLGRGTLKCADGTVLAGYFGYSEEAEEGGEREAQEARESFPPMPTRFLGTCARPDGTRYEGEMRVFSKGALAGRPPSEEGDWDPVFEETGQGRLLWPNGNHYDGSFQDGRRTGLGTHVKADGTKFEGEWLNGRPEGLGLLTEPSGARWIEDWLDSSCLRRSKLPQAASAVFVDSLAASLKEAINDPAFSDVTFKVEGKDFYAHRLICAGRSPLFRSMFAAPTVILTGNASGSVTQEFTIRDTSYRSFELLMGYIYTGAVDLEPVARSSDLFGLLDLACQHSLGHLKEQTERRLARLVSRENVPAFLLSADMYAASVLLEACRPHVRSLEPPDVHRSRELLLLLRALSPSLARYLEEVNPPLLAAAEQVERRESRRGPPETGRSPTLRVEEPVAAPSTSRSVTVDIDPGEHPTVIAVGPAESLEEAAAALDLDDAHHFVDFPDAPQPPTSARSYGPPPTTTPSATTTGRTSD
eukprot:tig00000615_g2604.t1